MVRRPGSVSPPTPRTSFEIWDFSELDAAEESIAVDKQEQNFKRLRDVEVGSRVQILNNAAAMLNACRAASIGTEHDNMRIALLGAIAHVLKKDPSDNTVLCSVSAVGDVWLPLPALLRVNEPPKVQSDAGIITPMKTPSGEASPTQVMPAAAGVAVSVQRPRQDSEKQKETHQEMFLESEQCNERNIEDIVTRRLQAQDVECKESVLGIQLVMEEACGSNRVKKLFRDVVNEIVAQHHTNVGDRIPPGSLLDRLGAMIAFLNGLLRFNFVTEGPRKPQPSFNFISSFIATRGSPEAAASKVPISNHCDNFVSLLRGKPGVSKGLGSIIQDKTSQKNEGQESTVDGIFRHMLACLAGLIGWVQWFGPEDRSRVEAAFAVVSNIVLQQVDNKHAVGANSPISDLDYVSDNCAWLEWAVAYRENAALTAMIMRTSVITATQLLHELRKGFQSKQFQERYLSLQNQVDLSCRDVHQQCSSMAFLVQAIVLPRYGFDATPAGVLEMQEEMHHYITYVKDKTITKLMKDIEQLLNLREHQKGRLKQVVERRRKSSFHTVGDSHSAHGWPSSVKTHYVGSLLCYNINRVRLEGLQPPIQAGDAVCFCFGEIDCRCHVHKHCEGERTYQNVIDEIISRYFSYLRTQVMSLSLDIHIFIYNVLPPVRAHIMYHRDGVMAYPWAGSDEERLGYVRYFNQRLQAECTSHGYTFFDVHDQYATEDGFLNMELSDGGVHVKESRPLKNFIDQMFK